MSPATCNALRTRPGVFGPGTTRSFALIRVALYLAPLSATYYHFFPPWPRLYVCVETCQAESFKKWNGFQKSCERSISRTAPLLLVEEHGRVHDRWLFNRSSAGDCLLAVDSEARERGRLALLTDVFEISDQFLRGRSIAQGVETAQHRLLVRAQPTHEPSIIECRLPLGRAHPLQSAETAVDQLLPFRRQLLPSRQENILHVLPLLGAHPLPDAFTIADGAALSGRKSIPVLQILADLRLTLGGQIVELLVVLKETSLLLGSHTLQ